MSNNLYGSFCTCLCYTVSMKNGLTPENFLALLEELEADAEHDHAFLREVTACTDDALLRGDDDAFLSLRRFFETPEQLKTMSRFSSLLQLRYILTAVKNERDLGYSLFTDGVNSFQALTDKMTVLNQMLRRIEFDIEPGLEEAFAFVRDRQISPYAVSAVLYGMTSKLGHREQVLLKLSEDALSGMRLKEAVGFLSVIEQPSEEALALRQELEGALREASRAV